MLAFARQSYADMACLLNQGRDDAAVIMNMENCTISDIVEMVRQLIPLVESPDAMLGDRWEVSRLAASVLSDGIRTVGHSDDGITMPAQSGATNEPMFADRPFASTQVIWATGFKHAEYIIKTHANPLATAVELTAELLSIIASPDTPYSDLKGLGDLAGAILLEGPRFGLTDTPGIKVTSYKRHGRRKLNKKELLDVSAKARAPVNGLPAFSGLDAMVAARPVFIEPSAARTIVDQLTAEGFTLDPNAPQNWLWQKIIEGTSCQHNLGFVNYGGSNRLRAYSLDLLWDGWRDVCQDEPVRRDLPSQVEAALARFPENEEVWASRGFTVT